MPAVHDLQDKQHSKQSTSWAYSWAFFAGFQGSSAGI